ncbi:hypothetical protein HAX54_026103 [Datura stramonium]|uniref:Response regulatory domain-containing protein n=1 Tax=Datura stramonium TaxID=4076 RepID=A0ABS8S7R5_DATST|nr:hypothetical protein [Datura stramonium]
MDCESSISCVPSRFGGLGILLVDDDITFLSNIASTLEEHSFKVMTSMMKKYIEEEAREQGAHFILMNPISSEKLKNVWKYVHGHQIEASRKSKHEAKGSKTMRSIDEETQHKSFDPYEEEDNSLIFKNTMDG